MTEGPVFTALQVYPRMAAKLLRPKPLSGLLMLRRLSDNQQDSLGALLTRRAATTPDGIAFRNEEGSLTWAEVEEQANRVADVLAKRGVGKGDVVAVSLENRQAWVTTVLGVFKLGAVAALINTGLRGRTLAHCVGVVEPKVLVVGEEQLPTFEGQEQPVVEWAPDVIFVPDAGKVACPAGMIDLIEQLCTASSEQRTETADVSFVDPAVYVYTSGTTGLPKASVNSHRRLYMGCLLSGRVLRELGPGDCVYAPLPLYHVTGLVAGWCASIYTGATFATARKFSATRYWDDVRRYDATNLIYIGELLRYLYNQPPSPLDRKHRVRSMAGAGLRYDIWEDFKSRFGIKKVYELYGASESPGGFFNMFNLDRTSGWCPTPWAVAEYDVEGDEIVRESDGRAHRLQKGGEGLLLFKVDKHAPFAGYTDREASAKKLFHDLFEPGDVWFNSGDLVLNQGCGHMKFVDRVGDTYRWRGENVATTQVELVVDEWPQIAESAAFGVKVPRTEGRCGMVRLVLRPGEVLDREGFAAHLRAHLPDFAVPRFVRLGTEIEVTGTFKQRKVELRKEGYLAPEGGERVLVLSPADTAWRDLEPSDLAAIDTGAMKL